MSDKDHLGSKLHDVEKAREDQYAAERDRELVEKLRKKQSEHRAAIVDETPATATGLCPRCNQALLPKTQGKIAMMVCPRDDGAWLDDDALKVVLATIK